MTSPIGTCGERYTLIVHTGTKTASAIEIVLRRRIRWGHRKTVGRRWFKSWLELITALQHNELAFDVLKVRP